MLMYITMIHYDSLQNFTTPANTNQFRIKKKLKNNQKINKSFSALRIALRQIWLPPFGPSGMAPRRGNDNRPQKEHTRIRCIGSLRPRSLYAVLRILHFLSIHNLDATDYLSR